MNVTPYLMLDGRGQEAIDFYKKAVGAEVEMLMQFKDAPEGCASGSEDKVMHATLRIGGSTVMLTDGNNQGNPDFKGISLSIGADSEAQAEKLYAALGEGGTVQMPMETTFFAKRFGMVADKFGVSWMVLAE